MEWASATSPGGVATLATEHNSDPLDKPLFMDMRHEDTMKCDKCGADLGEAPAEHRPVWANLACSHCKQYVHVGDEGPQNPDGSAHVCGELGRCHRCGTKKNDDDLGDALKLEGLWRTPEGVAPEVVERARGHLSQFNNSGITGFLFVNDEWIARRSADTYQRETDPEVVEYIKQTWVDNDIQDSIGTMYSPCAARPHCVIAPYT